MGVLRVGEGHFGDIGSAVAAAREGDTVEIAPGVYREQITVDKPIELRAAGVVTVSGDGTPLTLRASATVRGLSISCDGADAVVVEGRDVAPTVDRCVLSARAGVALTATAGASPTVRECQIVHATRGVVVHGEGTTATIRQTRIEDAGRAAVAVSGGARVTVTECEVDGGGTGLEVDGGTLVAADVIVTAVGGAGIRVVAGEGTFTRCWVTDAAEWGVWVGGGRAVLDQCDATNGRGGGFHLAGGDITLTGCLAHDNIAEGFRLQADAKLTACASYANGVDDGVGVQHGAPAPTGAESMEPANPPFDTVVARLTGDLAAMRAEAEAKMWRRADRLAAARLLAPLNERVERLRRLAAKAPGAPLTDPDDKATARAVLDEIEERRQALRALLDKRGGDGSLDDLLAELDALIGLAEVKAEVRTLVDIIAVGQRRAEAGLKAPPMSRHLVFTGRPGTGKTTVARLYGRILAALGLLGEGHLVEVSRVDLVAEYVGHTAVRTKAAFDRARAVACCSSTKPMRCLQWTVVATLARRRSPRS